MQSLVSGLFASRILFAAADGTAQSGMSDNVISSSILEGKKEFEAATGTRLNINRVPFSENFENFFSDLSSRSGKYDASIAGAWWLGELVGEDHLLSYDKNYNDPRFPKWNIDAVLTAPCSPLSHGGKKYMVANDHDGQVMYYRRDLLADAQHQAAFRQKYGYALDVPKTWAQLQDVAEYFNRRPESALKVTAVDVEEITIRLGRGRQRRVYRESLGFQ
ncbi:extracellular solute-binding protein [Pseudoduganella sp. LjRoot289]|uniref:extracellular solute-binding protein n=1 Tax=Pseudoduganella sp. LjRoot289 TaxID=3342314 RepID=UPI003ECED0BA